MRRESSRCSKIKAAFIQISTSTMHGAHCNFHSWGHSLDALKQGPREIAEAPEEGVQVTDPCVRFH